MILVVFWMCYVENERSPMVRHKWLSEAKKEAERLAQLKENAGKDVFILQAIESVKVTPRWTWTTLCADPSLYSGDTEEG